MLQKIKFKWSSLYYTLASCSLGIPLLHGLITQGDIDGRYFILWLAFFALGASTASDEKKQKTKTAGV